MVVIATRSRVIGPFKDGNEALAWRAEFEKNFALAEGPLVICHLTSPTIFEVVHHG